MLPSVIDARHATADAATRAVAEHHRHQHQLLARNIPLPITTLSFCTLHALDLHLAEVRLNLANSLYWVQPVSYAFLCILL